MEMAEEKKKSGKGEKRPEIKKENQFLEFVKRLVTNPSALVGLIIFAVIALACVFANFLAPYDPTKMDLNALCAGPSLAHPFGCDSLGRDLLSRLLYGGRYSLSIGLIVALITAVFGLIVGGLIGYIGGQVDMVAMRIVDLISAIPGTLLTIVLATVMEPNMGSLIIALTVAGLSGSVRGPRAMALRERSNEYVEAATSINANTWRILTRHIMPNIIAPTIIGTTMGIGGAITSVAGLAYLGLGVQEPTPEWGNILSDGRAYIMQYPHMIMIPGLVISVTVLAINLFGDGLRDALDPRLKK